MASDVALALAVTDQLRRNAKKLPPDAARALEADLGRIESRLHGGDPYAHVQDMLELQGKLHDSARSDQAPQAPAQPAPQAAQPEPAPPPPAPVAQTGQIGPRTATVLEAVDFTGFVSALIGGTFRAISDASAAQMREYANLVASLSQTLEDFTGDNVTINQARDHLAKQFPQDLMLKLPPPGSEEQPKILPRPERTGESPAWLEKYGLKGEELTEELTEGPLLEAARRKVGEGRMSSLAAMVLMGVNRIVVNEGDVRAKVQLHAAAIDVQRAEGQTQQMGVVQRDAGDVASALQMMVSTVKANAQADAAIKVDLMGEVRVSFRSETFPLERFADSAAIQLINRHAKWQREAPAATGPAATGPAAAAPAAPAPAASGGGAK